MKRLLLGFFLILLLIMPSFAEGTDEQAIIAAENFAQMIDDGNFQAAYWSGSALLQLANEEQQWLDKTARTQLVLGKVIRRELKRVRAVTSPADLPDDEYRTILFEAHTERKEKAAEVLQVHQVNGIWQVCAYAIR